MVRWLTVILEKPPTERGRTCYMEGILMFSFAYDSVVERDEPQKSWHLVRTATSFECEFHDFPIETSEGYVVFRYIVLATTQEDWEAFASSVSKNMPDSEWFPLSS